MAWTTVDTGHELTLRDGDIIARNAKGTELKSVPAKVKKTEAYEKLESLREFLVQHDAEAGTSVRQWMLASEPVTRVVLAEVWVDAAWRSWLTDLIVSTEDGSVTGFLRDADADGLGVVDLDGETARITSDIVRIPHPALIEDLDELREFAVELGITQRFDQLFREVHRRASESRKSAPVSARTLARCDSEYYVTDFANGEFEAFGHAIGRATSAGFTVRNGSATTTITEGGQKVTADYSIGDEYYDGPTCTGVLRWSGPAGFIRVSEVGPVAYSEGMRMAAHIYAGRNVKEGQK